MATITNLKFAIDSSWNGAGVTAARADLKLLQQDLRRVQNTKIRVEVDVNDTSARAALRKLDNDTRNRAMEIRVDADTKFAEAQIDHAARDRHSNIFVNTHGANDEIMKLDHSLKQASNSSVELGNSASIAMRWAKLGAMAFLASLVVLPGIIQTIGGALTVGLGGAFIAMGALFNKENQALKDGVKSLADTFMESGKRASAGMIQPMIDGLRDLRQHVIGLEPQFKKAFDGASQAIAPLVDGLAWMVENSMPGVIKAMQNITPVANGLRDGMANFGTQMSRMFDGMSQGAAGLGQALNSTFTQIGVLMANFGVAAGQMAEKGAALWDGFLKGFNNFVAGYLDGMVKMVQQNGPAFGQFWIDFGNAVGGFLREALPGIGRLAAAFSNILGPALRDLLPPLGRLVSKMADSLVPIMEKAEPVIMALVDGFVKIIDWLGKFAPVLGPVTAGIWLLNAAMNANPVVLLVTGIVLLTAGIVHLATETQFFQNLWKGAPDWIKAPFEKGADGTSQFSRGLDGVKDKVSSVWTSMKDWGSKLGDLFGPSFQEIFRKVKEAVSEAWDSIRTSFSGLMDTLRPLWQELKPVLAVIGGLLLGIGKIALDMIANGIKPAFRMFGEIISEIIQVIKGVIQVITGVIRFCKGVVEVIVGLVRMVAAFFTGNNEAFTNAAKVFRQGFTDIIAGIGKAFQGLWTIVTAVWDSITSIFRNGAQIVWGLVSGFVEGVVNFFKWLWDVLVGHSIVPDLLNAIWDWFMWLPRKIIGIVEGFVNGVVNFFKWLWDQVTEKFNAFWNWYSGMWSSAWNWARDFVAGIWDWLVGKWNGFWDSVGQRWTAFRDWLSGLWNTFWTWVRDHVSGIWDSIVGKFEAIKTKIGEIVQGMVDKVRDIWNTVTGIFQKPVDAVKGIWNGVAGVFGLPKFAEGGEVGKYATGGAVFGAGTATSDSIPAMLSNNEHVWTAAEVDAAGGHGAMYAWRKQVMARKGLRWEDNSFSLGGPAYAGGGAVERLDAATAMAKEKGDGRAYVYGGSGPSGFDCSGYMSAIYNVLQGAGNWWQRRFTTEDNFEGLGFARGLGAGFSVGIMRGGGGPNSHMAGTLNGVNVESGGSHNSTRYGGPAAGADSRQFSLQYHLPIVNGAFVSGGAGGGYGGPSPEQIAKHKEATEAIKRVISETFATSASRIGEANRYAAEQQTPGFQGPVNILTPVSPTAVEYLKNKYGIFAPAGDTHSNGTGLAGDGAIKKLDEALQSAHGAFGGEIPTGDRAAIIQAALGLTNTPPPSTVAAWMAGMNTLITRESNWNPNAINNWDSNAASGTPSKGLAQVIDPTFRSHMAPGHGNIWDPVDNVAASINYIKSRYGTIENVQQANANMSPAGYAMGTSNATAGWHLVGENGPEMVEFKGGETVKTFDEIIAALKTAATTEGRQTAEKVSAELKSLIDKISQMNFGNNEVNITIQIDGAQDVIAVVDQVKAQLIPQLEMLLRQKVGIRG
ncbi:tape measure protein [Rhodococcus phage Shagrat]|nr:tape measure protein [Rhodococcus phage Shagrat]